MGTQDTVSLLNVWPKFRIYNFMHTKVHGINMRVICKCELDWVFLAILCKTNVNKWNQEISKTGD
jgi:hypothetical protein